MFNDIKEALDYIESKRVKRTFEQFQEIVTKYSFNAVSYTHLDVYKRQLLLD